MFNPALLLIKPLLKAIGKEAVKLLAAQATAEGFSVGLAKIASGKLTALDAVNVARAAVDRKILPSVAKALNLSTQELKGITKGLNMTKARTAAVKGRNFIRNVNRFTESPQTSIKSYLRDVLQKRTRSPFEEDDTGEEYSTQTLAVINALHMLEGKLQKYDPSFRLPDTLYQNADKIDIEDVYEALSYTESDLYYALSGGGSTIWIDDQHKGYREGMENEEFLEMITDMMLKGYHSTPINGII